ncbi:MAG: hypothetical protein WBA76_19555 [Phormidesmis sp.]
MPAEQPSAVGLLSRSLSVASDRAFQKDGALKNLRATCRVCL